MKTVGDIIFKKEEPPASVLFLVWVGLLLLLLITWRVAYIRLGDFNLILALIIGIAKAALVLWVFMNLRGSPKLVLLLFGMALVMAFIGTLLTFSDYLMRA